MTPSQVATLPPQPTKVPSDTDSSQETNQEMPQPVPAQETTTQGSADNKATIMDQSSLPVAPGDLVPELVRNAQYSSGFQSETQEQEQQELGQEVQVNSVVVVVGQEEISDTLENDPVVVALADSIVPAASSDLYVPPHQQPKEREEGNSVQQRKTDDSSVANEETSPQSTPSSSSVPKQSAWSTLLPGVAPIPAPKPPAPAPTPRVIKSTENIRQLHELYPIVLPHESEVKLSMEMIDLFEVCNPTAFLYFCVVVFVTLNSLSLSPSCGT